MIKKTAAILLFLPFGAAVCGEVGTGEHSNIDSEEPGSEEQEPSNLQDYLDAMTEFFVGEDR